MDSRIQNPAGWSDQLFADIVNMDYDYGFKFCTCEKNHCLKHYCECFAAGLFCVESCACKDCSNILENKAKVLDRRENIESRNLPWILPFDHEVIQEINELPATKVPARTEDNNQSEIYSSVAANSDYTCLSTPIVESSNKWMKISSPTILPVCILLSCSYSDFFTGEVYCEDSSSCEDLKVVSFPESIEDDLIELRKANEVLEIPENFECWNVLGLDPEVVSVAAISTGVNRTESDALVAADSDTCFTTSIVKSCNETMKISSKFSEARGTIKCTCKKDRCSKLNCECLASGEYCLKSCACEDCNNIAEAREEIASSKCQCKENECMKYSSGCFADRKYCTGNCGCQGCRNYPENEHKSVEARNAKERKGCKCCRSKCLRGRCWCHKEGVGCSEACKCTGCENNYGQNPKRRYDNSDKSI